MTHSQFSIGEVAERTGLSIHTLRYYESAGLVPGEVARNDQGQRTYDESDITWFEVCSSLRRSGMPIAVLRSYVELVEDGDGNEAERLAILQAHQDSLDKQLADLSAARDLVVYKIGIYSDRIQSGTAADLWSRKAT